MILIDLTTEEGVTGRAYLEPYIPRAMKYLVPALEDIGEYFKGRKLAPVQMFDEARRSLQFVGYEGLTMISVAGFDMVAWDTLARAANMPLCEFLGGSVMSIKSYNSNGLWLNDPSALADEALALRDEGGFSGLKLRMGRANSRDDIAAFEVVRAAVGDDVALMVDFNQGFGLSEALVRCHELDDLGLAWIEEPVQYDDFDGYKHLTDQLKTPIQMGENFYGPRDMHRAIKGRICDLVMPDFMRIGGITGWLRAAAIAGAAGIPVSTHLYPEVAAHVMTVTENAHWLEWQNWADPILQQPYAVKDSHLHIPDKPGLGLAWNESAIADFTFSG